MVSSTRSSIINSIIPRWLGMLSNARWTLPAIDPRICSIFRTPCSDVHNNICFHTHARIRQRNFLSWTCGVWICATNFIQRRWTWNYICFSALGASKMYAGSIWTHLADIHYSRHKHVAYYMKYSMFSHLTIRIYEWVCACWPSIFRAWLQQSGVI